MANLKFLKLNSAFSLIELMVVISIISTLISFALPNYYKLKVQAARVEAKQIQNHVYTAAEAYGSENGRFYDGSVGFSKTSPNSNCNGGNALGIRLTDCSKLRYAYLIESTPILYDIIAYHEVGINGSGSITTQAGGGTPIPVSFCPPIFGAAHYYFDAFSMNQNREITVIGDVISSCL